MRVNSPEEAKKAALAYVRHCGPDGTMPCVLVSTTKVIVKDRPDIGPKVKEVIVTYTVDEGRSQREGGVICWMGPECPDCKGTGYDKSGPYLRGCPTCGGTGVISA